MLQLFSMLIKDNADFSKSTTGKKSEVWENVNAFDTYTAHTYS